MAEYEKGDRVEFHGVTGIVLGPDMRGILPGLWAVKRDDWAAHEEDMRLIRKRGESEGPPIDETKAPEPLPEVLPAGTQWFTKHYRWELVDDARLDGPGAHWGITGRFRRISPDREELDSRGCHGKYISSHMEVDWASYHRALRSPSPSPPVEASSETAKVAQPPASVATPCACGQTAWRDETDYDGSPICGDCSSMVAELAGTDGGGEAGLRGAALARAHRKLEQTKEDLDRPLRIPANKKAVERLRRETDAALRVWPSAGDDEP